MPRLQPANCQQRRKLGVLKVGANSEIVEMCHGIDLARVVRGDLEPDQDLVSDNAYVRVNSNGPVGVLHRWLSDDVADTVEPETIPIVVPPASLVQTLSSGRSAPMLNAPASVTVPDTSPLLRRQVPAAWYEPKKAPPAWLVIDQV